MSTARTTDNRVAESASTSTSTSASGSTSAAAGEPAVERDSSHLLPAQRNAAVPTPPAMGAGQEPAAPTPTPDHRLRWPEALAITLALLLGGAVASGVFRPMLPWLG
ncbi:hypothetical protein GCM10009838_43250 [Catenulispora subtropica]|uniref:Uncharacterized protein n=1 Tax=Catenulispora subtropica TaxID=450798 RepID=A0ABP5DDV5_9ACTN